MSGLAGCMRLDGGHTERNSVEAIVSALPRRAASGVGLWTDGPVGLAQLGAPLVPASANETEPVHVDGVVIVGDARLDGRDALSAELSEAGETFGDLALLGRAWVREGDDVFARLTGEFAVAIWEPRKRRLTCARDVFGVKPFAFHRSPSLFVFASQPSAVTAHPGVPRRPSELAIARYLIDDLDDAEGTFFQGVNRLPPAHTLTIDAGSTRPPRRYYSFPTQDLRGNDSSFETEFRDRFLDAVDERLIATRPVGLGLSGGLDSTAVVGAARRLHPDRTPATYSVVFNHRAADERRYIRVAASALGIVPTLLSEAQVSPSPEALSDPDGPYVSSGKVMEDALFRRAAADGVGVFIDGFDGDTVVSHGVAIFAELAATGRIGQALRGAVAFADRLGRDRAASIRSLVLSPNAPSWAHAMRTRFRGAKSAPWLAAEELLIRCGLPRRAPTRRPARGWTRDEHLRYLTGGQILLTLEVLDHLAVRSGVEVRHPFFDRRLVELCLGLPIDQILRDGWTRSIQRRALRDIVPAPISTRPDKAVVGTHLAAGFALAAWPQITQMVAAGGGATAPYVDRRQLRQWYERASIDGDPLDLVGLWLNLQLESWLRTFE